MPSPVDAILPAPPAAGLQTISLLFNAASLASAALRPPFRTQIARIDPNADNADASSFLDLVTVDATLRETHSAAAEVTEHPVEAGADISDHVRPKPVEVRIEGVITDTPLIGPLEGAMRAIPGLGLGAATLQTAQNLLSKATVARGAFDTLRKLRDLGEPVTLYTPYRQYFGMVMTDLQVVRDTEGGEGLRFSAAFREVLTVESAIVRVQLPVFAQGALDLGTLGTSPAGTKLKSNISALYQLGNLGKTSGGPLDSFKTWVTQ